MSTSSSNHLVLTAVIASLGGILLGSDTTVIAGTTHALTDAFYLSPMTWGITVSSALWGTILGFTFSGSLSHSYFFAAVMALQFIVVLFVYPRLGEWHSKI